jgi:uncharacterized MAPEG superfamily protein
MALPNNFSIIAIPVYYVLALLPHAHALRVATLGKPEKWDNRNPRSVTLKADLRAKLPAEIFAQYERCEAASANCYENMPVFGLAILAGHVAKVDKAVIDQFAFRFLLVRTAYVWSYMTTSSQKWSYVRTVLYFYSIYQCFKMYARAAKALQ